MNYIDTSNVLVSIIYWHFQLISAQWPIIELASRAHIWWYLYRVNQSGIPSNMYLKTHVCLRYFAIRMFFGQSLQVWLHLARLKCRMLFNGSALVFTILLMILLKVHNLKCITLKEVTKMCVFYILLLISLQEGIISDNIVLCTCHFCSHHFRLVKLIVLHSMIRKMRANGALAKGSYLSLIF